jgi:hypothetical protein
LGRLLVASPRSISFAVHLLPFVFAAIGALIETTMLSALFGSSVDIGCSFLDVLVLLLPCAEGPMSEGMLG